MRQTQDTVADTSAVVRDLNDRRDTRSELGFYGRELACDVGEEVEGFVEGE